MATRTQRTMMGKQTSLGVWPDVRDLCRELRDRHGHDSYNDLIVAMAAAYDEEATEMWVENELLTDE